MATPKAQSGAIDMSLRLQSQEVPLDDFVSRLGFVVRYQHRPGEPMAASGPLARRLSNQHYVSLTGSDSTDAAAWVGSVVAAVEPITPLVNDLRAGRVTGVLWIAVLGREPAPTPGIPPYLIESVSKLGLRVFLENYTTWDGEGDAPPKVWLPEPVVSSAVSDAI